LTGDKNILSKINEYWDKNIIFHTDDSWVDSNLTFCKYLQNEAMSVQTNVNYANGLIILHVRGINWYLANGERTDREGSATMNK
jgi:hypothetical protein